MSINNWMDEIDLSKAEFDFEPYDSKRNNGVETVNSVFTEIEDNILVVELDDPVEINIIEGDYSEKLNQVAGKQLAYDRVEEIVNGNDPIAKTRQHEKILDEQSTSLMVLEGVVDGSAVTRIHLQDSLGMKINNSKLTQLQDKNLISHIGKDGNAYVFCPTPLGVKEVLSHSYFESINGSNISDSFIEATVEQTDDKKPDEDNSSVDESPSLDEYDN